MRLSCTFSDTLQYTTGQRGCVQLIFNQHTYVKNAVTGTRIIWKCSRKVFSNAISSLVATKKNEPFTVLQGSRRCRSKVVTDVVDGQNRIVKVSADEHTHEVNIKRKKPLISEKASSRDPKFYFSNVEYISDEGE